MPTIFNIDDKKRFAPTGYNEGNDADYVIPSCGLEDLDKSMFDLFDKEIPLFFDMHGTQKKVPVIFATGERFALIRRKKPLVDRDGALILPLISITRTSVDNIPQKGIANNQMFPETITKRISAKDLEYRQNKNIENLKNVKGEDLNLDPNLSLKPRLEKNIIETIELPPVKYFSAVYDITLWTSFTQQMNSLLESIMSSFTLNPSQQFQLKSEKGYTFSAFMESSFSQDSNYADFTDAERYIKYTMNINATGYIIAPNILGGKTAIKSFLSAPEVSFDVLADEVNLEPQVANVADLSPDAHVFDDLATEDYYLPAQNVGIDSSKNSDHLLDFDSSQGLAVSENTKKYVADNIGTRGTDYKSKRKTFVRDSEGRLVPVMAKASRGKGETVYDARLGEVLFNISSKSE